MTSPPAEPVAPVARHEPDGLHDGLPSKADGHTTSTIGLADGGAPAGGAPASGADGGGAAAHDTGLIAVSSHSSLAGSTGSDTPNHTLYLGNLHPFVTEAMLQEVFAGLSGINELKVIKDKATGVSAGYGFAKFSAAGAAQAALERVNKALIFGQEMRVNWAFQKEVQEEVASHIHIFVGDLSPDVGDATLLAAFRDCPGCSDARVMWDHATGRSRGYGFVSFRAQAEAEAAIAAMHGQFVGARRVRCGWAQHKTDTVAAADPTILDRADPTNTNVYVGNLAPQLTGESRAP
jgi:nucleolysin TIA-1/TIAR